MVAKAYLQAFQAFSNWLQILGVLSANVLSVGEKKRSLLSYCTRLRLAIYVVIQAMLPTLWAVKQFVRGIKIIWTQSTVPFRPQVQ